MHIKRRYLGCLWVSRQQSPINICTVTNISIVALIGSRLKNALYELLVLGRLLQEELDRGS